MPVADSARSIHLGAWSLEQWDAILCESSPRHASAPRRPGAARTWASVVTAAGTPPPAPQPRPNGTHLVRAPSLSSTSSVSSPPRPTPQQPPPVPPPPPPQQPLAQQQQQRRLDPPAARLADRLGALEGMGVRELPRAPRLTPRGLVNSGNACFMNVVFQALLACEPFRALLSALEKTPVPEATCPLLSSFVRLARELRRKPSAKTPPTTTTTAAAPTSPPKRTNGALHRPPREADLGDAGVEPDALRPDYMYDSLAKRRGSNGMAISAMFSRGSQEDAQEFLTHVLDGLHEEMLALQGAASHEQPLANGHHEDAEGWEEMSRKGKTVLVRPTEFRKSCISAVFGGSLRSELRKPNEKPSVTREPFVCLQLDVEHAVIHSLEDALTKYFEPESLEGFTLESTKEKVEAKKTFYLESLPTVFILHVKRFSYNHETRTFSKVARRIEFPDTLTINVSQLSSPSVAPSPMDRQYRLAALVTHLGKELAGGHYTCDVRTDDEDAEWVLCDDSKLTPVTLAKVLGRQAYLLFYTRICARPSPSAC